MYNYILSAQLFAATLVLVAGLLFDPGLEDGVNPGALVPATAERGVPRTPPQQSEGDEPGFDREHPSSGWRDVTPAPS
jgi:hypothetical protein